MKAMVMSAGAGTRLMPLTYEIPKPMVPVVNKPVLEHALELLKNHGIEEVVLNLYSHPEMIKSYFKDGSWLGMKISYSVEKKLMGTAGGVKKVEKFFNEPFLVMSGDGLTKVNLSKIIEFEKRKKALGVIGLKRQDTRFEYGVVLTEKNGRVKKFIEKPSWKDVFHNTINTGIYIFNPQIFKFIPKNKFYDFGNDLLPFLLNRKKRIFGLELKGYWRDIGNLNEYKKAQNDVLDGKINLKIPGKKIKKGIWVGKDTKIFRGVRFRPPCVIGKNCRIGKWSNIGPYTVIGDGCMVGEKTSISDSILWKKVHVKKKVYLKSCIIGNNAEVSENISVFEGSVINIRR